VILVIAVPPTSVPRPVPYPNRQVVPIRTHGMSEWFNPIRFCGVEAGLRRL